MNFLNLTNTSWPLDSVKKELERFCSTPWNQVGRTYPLSLPYLCPSALPPHHTLMVSLPRQIKLQHPAVKVKYLAGYCFSGTYILTLLTEGYNFTSESYSSIQYIKQVSRSRSTPFLSYTRRFYAFFYILFQSKHH